MPSMTLWRLVNAMMKPRHATTKLQAIDLMLEICISEHLSHAHRNERLSVIRSILDEWIPQFNSYTSDEDEERKTRQTLEAIYQLCIWSLDHETHRLVKNRLWLARNLIAKYFARIEELRQKRYSGIRDHSPTFETEDVLPLVLDDLPF